MTLPTPDPAFHWSVEPWGRALVCTPLQANAQHLFTTKQLQLRPAKAGDPQSGPWTSATASLGGRLDQLMRVKQVHGRAVRVLPRGGTTVSDWQDRPDADAIVSNEPDLILAVQVADCIPILMADRRSGAAAAVHAGWRGTCAGIAGAAVEAMAEEFGTRPQDLVVALGPGIGACCYEVGISLIDEFRGAGAIDEDIQRWFVRPSAESLRLDLWTANSDQLRASGVAADRIHLSRLCTQTHADIFESYRVDGTAAGRMAGLIRVPHV